LEATYRQHKDKAVHSATAIKLPLISVMARGEGVEHFSSSGLFPTVKTVHQDGIKIAKVR